MGTYTVTDATAQVVRNLRDYGTTLDEQLLGDTEIEPYVTEAVARYSADRPREAVADLIADGTLYTALPAGFLETDVVRAIEYPLEQTPPEYADPRVFALYRTPTGRKLRWLYVQPAENETLRMTYATVHVLGGVASETTIPDQDFPAVCHLATSRACDAIAAKYARSGEPAFNADVVSYRTQSQEWAARAKRWADLYREAVPETPADGAVNWDSRFSGGVDWLTHGRTFR